MFKHLPPPPVGCGLNIGCVPCITTIASGGGERASATLLALLTNRCKRKTVRCVSLSYTSSNLHLAPKSAEYCSIYDAIIPGSNMKWSFLVKSCAKMFQRVPTENQANFLPLTIRHTYKCITKLINYPYINV